MPAPTDAPPLTPIALTVEQACAYTGLPKRRVYELVRAKELPAAREGKSWLIDRAGIDAWWAARLARAGHEVSLSGTE